MSQTSALIDTLKKQLRAQGKTYRDVGKAIHLSEASVKRLFSQQSFTLQRLEQICTLAGLEFADLVASVEKNRRQLVQLTQEQEGKIASDIVLLMVTVSVINGFSYTDLLDYYHLSETECTRKLALLDKLKLIDLLPGNRIKLRISPNFRWLPNGPIQKFFHEKIEHDFFNSRFDSEAEKLLVINGLFSSVGNRILQEKMEDLAHQFASLHKKEMALPMEERFGTTMVIALRQWRFSLFEEYVKKRKE